MEQIPVRCSKVTQTRLIFPPDTNHLGTIFGGKVLAYIDEVAALTAMKHSNAIVVTASIDSVNFISTARVGEALTIEACVTKTGRTSMEVYVKVFADDLLSGDQKMTTESFLTMVAMDEEGRPKPVPHVVPETEEEIELNRTAAARKKQREEKAELRT